MPKTTFFSETVCIISLLGLTICAQPSYSTNVEVTKPPIIKNDKNQISAESDILLPKQSYENAIKLLSAKDKAILEQIQNQVINWPEGTFKEVRNYKDFVINSRNQAKEMYNKLSNEAKEAIKIEKEFKSQLSPEGLKILNSIDAQ